MLHPAPECGERTAGARSWGIPVNNFLVAATVVLALAAPLSAQRTFRAGVDLVNFGVFVTDRQGAPITGLTAADFEVVEAGKPQTIQFFTEGPNRFDFEH